MALLTELSEPTTSDVIQARLLECIGEKTDAGARVFAPRDWPTRGDKFPMILVQTPYEKISRQGAGDAIFDATTIVRVIGRVDTIASEDDEGAVVALADLARLQRQIEYAAVNHYKSNSCSGRSRPAQRWPSWPRKFTAKSSRTPRC